MFNTFEATGNMSDWPKNEPGKPTQVAVFGLKLGKEKLEYQILWTAKFPDLERIRIDSPRRARRTRRG